MKKIKVSILGLGVVGTQVAEYIESYKEKAANEDVLLELHRVYVRNIHKKRKIDTSQIVLTEDPYEAMDGADVIIECIGGNGARMTKELVETALKNKQAVVMSSKKCLARYGKELQELAEENTTWLRYDATVGGGIPISWALEEMGYCEEIKEIYGICNATSNYIVSCMEEQEMTYEQALKQAQKLGIAENDPAEDVDGYDTLYKAIILGGFGMKNWVQRNYVKPASIRGMTRTEIQGAKKEGYVIRPCFSVKQTEGRMTIEAGPKRVRKDSMLASVKGRNNMIVIVGSESGERAFYGLGAGARPTASAMFDDLIKLSMKL